MVVSDPASFPRPVTNLGGRARRIPSVLLYSVIGIIGIFAVVVQIRITFDLVKGLAENSLSPRTPFLTRGYPLRVTQMMPEAEAAGMRMGDEVVAVNDQPIRGVNTFNQVINNAKPGSMLRAAVMRDKRPVAFSIQLRAGRFEANRALNFGLSVVLGLLMPWLSLTLGIYVVAVRPRDALAWIVWGLLLSFSQLVNLDASLWSPLLRVPAELYHTIWYVAWPLFMFLFGYYFPQRPNWEKRMPWLKWIFLIAAVGFGILALLNAIEVVGVTENIQLFGPFLKVLAKLAIPISILSFTLITGGITLLAFKTFGPATSRDARRRLRLLFAGLLLSLTPILIVSLLIVFSHRPMDDLPDWLVIPSLFMLLLFPLSLAYVIVVDRAMDVRVAIRQGLRYAFARSGLAVLRVVLVALIIGAGYFVVKTSHGNMLAIGLFSAVAVLVAVKMNLELKRLGLWIDRRFFRDAYDAELVLSELSEQVRSIRETEPLLQTVCDRISKALHLSRISVLLEREGNYRTCMASGFDSQPEVGFPGSSAVIAHLRESQEPPHLYFEDAGSWLYRTPGMDDEQRGRLAYLGAELLLPLSTRDKLLGFIAVGQKRSEEPYTTSDIRILSSVASQTGLALENAELTNAIAAEMAQRERLAREVEIAREVQERLFPQTFPAIAGLDYWGMCRTALGVGGDYFDFLALPGERLGFAVGDVAGKGISAALLMASLQASLRAEAAYGGDDLAGIIRNLNTRVFEASSNNRYATFFYGQYSAATLRLDYVNAGHNPPIVLRRDGAGWTQSQLDATGTVVGLLRTSQYQQEAVQLASGDYLVLFTDGISEAMNLKDEEWGEECLAEVVRACAQSSLSARETVNRILSAADAFVNGAKQHDDMTIVVLRVV